MFNVVLFLVGLALGAFGIWNVLVGAFLIISAVQLRRVEEKVPIFPTVAFVALIYAGILCILVGLGSIAVPLALP